LSVMLCQIFYNNNKLCWPLASQSCVIINLVLESLLPSLECSDNSDLEYNVESLHDILQDCTIFET
jgi:hypothetical protein